MKQGVLILVLAMSLLFNLFFAAGFMRARAEARKSLRATDPEAMYVARDLNLDEPQRAAFEQMRATMRDEQVAFADSLALVRQELIDELNSEQPDLEKVRFAVTRETDLLAQRRQAETARFSAFVGLLNPDQCRRLSQRLGGRGPMDGRFGPGPGSGHGGPGMPERPDGPEVGGQDGPQRGGPGGRPFLERMQRFDANKDGKLDESERAAARQALEERIRQDRERREETFNRFDADHDGKLDRGELEQMNRFMFEQWRDRPRQGGSRPPAGPPGTPPPPLEPPGGAEPAPSSAPAGGADSSA